MERLIKFSFMWQHQKTGEWLDKIYTLDRIIAGDPYDDMSDSPLLRNYHHKHTREFTGLKDKNGKEIYESDLIKVLCYDGKSYNEFTVYYDPFSCCYVPNFGRLESSDIEVIGNIYENPEYLKNKVDKEGTNVL